MQVRKCFISLVDVKADRRRILADFRRGKADFFLGSNRIKIFRDIACYTQTDFRRPTKTLQWSAGVGKKPTRGRGRGVIFLK